MQPPAARLLVVDDVEANRDLLARRLRQLGHQVALADGGEAALAAIQREEFDLILLDVMMPVMDGYEVLRRLQSDPARCHIPVIMVTAVDQVDSVVRCIELGATDYLPKPFNPVILKARVNATLEQKRLRDRERLHAKSMERELEIGRQIQASFLPETLPAQAGWEIAASFHPARQVAGDFYDAFVLGSGRIGLVVADVCDKGVGAALFMALFRSLIRAAADLAEKALPDVTDPVERAAARVRNAVVFTNDYIARTHASANMFATLFFGILDPSTGSLTYVNGGHEPPVVRSASASGVGALQRLAPTGPALGLLPDRTFEVGRTMLAPGDLFLAFTDGVSEATSEGGEEFGEERLASVLRAHRDDTATALLEAIVADVRGHSSREQFDDLTLIVAKVS